MWFWDLGQFMHSLVLYSVDVLTSERWMFPPFESCASVKWVEEAVSNYGGPGEFVLLPRLTWYLELSPFCRRVRTLWFWGRHQNRQWTQLVPSLLPVTPQPRQTWNVCLFFPGNVFTGYSSRLLLAGCVVTVLSSWVTWCRGGATSCFWLRCHVHHV